MRVSIVEGDPGWVVDPISYHVTLDGRTVPAVTADEEEGFVLTWIRGLDGHPTTELQRGRVRIQRWEQGCVDHPEGTIGWLDDDGWWTWVAPTMPEYPHLLERKRAAMHIWDSSSRAWLNPQHLVRS